MTSGMIVADRLERVVMTGFDIPKISKEAFSLYQEPELSLSKELDMVLLSLMAMEEGPEFEMTEEEFKALLSEVRKM